jgi:hypothetical protein
LGFEVGYFAYFELCIYLIYIYMVVVLFVCLNEVWELGLFVVFLFLCYNMRICVCLVCVFLCCGVLVFFYFW